MIRSMWSGLMIGSALMGVRALAPAALSAQSPASAGAVSSPSLVTSGQGEAKVTPDRVSVLVNSLGATPPEELYILYRVVAARLGDVGAAIVMPLIGRYATSMEMTGVSITLCKLDAELEKLLHAPADCAFWRV